MEDSLYCLDNLLVLEYCKYTLEEKGAMHLFESRPLNLAFAAKFRNLSKRLTTKLPLGFVDLCGTNCRKLACSK